MAKKVQRIVCENAYEKMWDTYVYFESEPTTKTFLEDIYLKQKFEESKRLAFQNTPKFIYFIKQSREYFNAAKQSHILVKPLLVYYGMMSLIKSVVLTMDPHYPSNTSVLRHGITTRKIKKLDYIFNEDEIKIQKEGLMPHFYQLLTEKEHWPNHKYKVKELLSLIPELQESFCRSFGSPPIGASFVAGHRDLETGNTVGQMPDYNKNNPSFLPETVVHYLLMYNLGMLCRYETELWGEIIFSFSSGDMFMINEFINVAIRKFPNLILNMLFDEVLIFNQY